MIEWVLLSILVGIINLTNIRFGLLFIGEPLVIGLLTGLYVQDMALGLYIGAVFQFMWIKSIPIGVKVQVNYTIMTFISVILIHGYGDSVFPLVFFFGYLFSLLGRLLEISMKRMSNGFVEKMMKDIEHVRFVRSHLLFLVFHAAVFSALTFFGLQLSDLMVNFLSPLLPEKLKDAFSFTYPFLALYAMAMFFHSIEFNLKSVYLVIGLFLGLALMFLNVSLDLRITLLATGATLITIFQQKILRSRRESA